MFISHCEIHATLQLIKAVSTYIFCILHGLKLFIHECVKKLRKVVVFVIFWSFLKKRNTEYFYSTQQASTFK